MENSGKDFNENAGASKIILFDVASPTEVTMTFDEMLHDPRTEESTRGYMKCGLLGTPIEIEKVHMFFSPTVVPFGLTRGEIEVCFRLFPLREAQKRAFESKYAKQVSQYDFLVSMLMATAVARGLESGKRLTYDELRKWAEEKVARMPPQPDVMIALPLFCPPMLPRELCTRESISREDFRNGIHFFVEEATRMIKRPKGQDRYTRPKHYQRH
jgi:hypothetical protein